ncbi:MAG: TlpA family protein disulfide reductase [Alistipes sp.]|jgi:peroxiredoxin|nr:TlpA family protein disulfide reductase [Alistipes sp.]
MKKQIFIALLALGAFWAGGIDTARAQSQFPSVRIENAAGQMINTSTLAAKRVPLIVSFWSTTCKPCILELNAMNDLLDEWREEAEFEVIAVSIDDARSSSVAKALANGNGWDRFTVLYDKNQDFKRALNVSMAPHTFIFDANGRIIYSHVGYTPGTEEEYIEKIKSLN